MLGYREVVALLRCRSLASVYLSKSLIFFTGTVDTSPIAGAN